MPDAPDPALVERTLLPCGHPGACVSTADDGTSHCRWCEEVARLTAERDAWKVAVYAAAAEPNPFGAVMRLRASIEAIGARGERGDLIADLRAERDAAVQHTREPAAWVEAAGIQRDEAVAREQVALVAGAVLVRAAREALRRYGRHKCVFLGGPHGEEPVCGCGLDAALDALDGGGDVREWLDKAVEAGVARGWWERSRRALVQPPTIQQIVDAALARPPSLPAAAEALAEAFAWCEAQDHPGATAAGWWRSLARRWLAGEGRTK